MLFQWKAETMAYPDRSETKQHMNTSCETEKPIDTCSRTETVSWTQNIYALIRKPNKCNKVSLGLTRSRRWRLRPRSWCVWILLKRAKLVRLPLDLVSGYDSLSKSYRGWRKDMIPPHINHVPLPISSQHIKNTEIQRTLIANKFQISSCHHEDRLPHHVTSCILLRLRACFFSWLRTVSSSGDFLSSYRDWLEHSVSIYLIS